MVAVSYKSVHGKRSAVRTLSRGLNTVLDASLSHKSWTSLKKEKLVAVQWHLKILRNHLTLVYTWFTIFYFLSSLGLCTLLPFDLVCFPRAGRVSLHCIWASRAQRGFCSVRGVKHYQIGILFFIIIAVNTKYLSLTSDFLKFHVYKLLNNVDFHFSVHS